MPRAARPPTTYSVYSINLVLLVLLARDLVWFTEFFTPLGSDNSHFFKWLFTKMEVSMVIDPESELELAESHLMLKDAWLCFRISSSFVCNNPTLQFHSFSEVWGKCNKTGNPSISDFSTILTSNILILADSSQLPSDEAYRQRLSLPCYRLSLPCLATSASPRSDIFWQNFIKPRFCWGKMCLLCHMTTVGWLEIMIQHTPSIIWNPVHLVQDSTRWYVLVRANMYLTRYKAVRETSKWYIPVRTNIGNSYASTYWYVLVCTALYLHSTRWYKVVQDGTRW